MATGRSMQLTKQLGEYLVAAELCRRGLISTTFAGNVPTFDILAVNARLKTIPIQVKTIRGGSWQFDAEKFLEIKKEEGIQEAKGKKDLANPDLIYIFVKLVQHNKDEFYICTMRELQDIIYKNHTKWLSKHKGKRPRNPKSTHCSVYSDDLKKYKNKWDILTEQLSNFA